MNPRDSEPRIPTRAADLGLGDPRKTARILKKTAQIKLKAPAFTFQPAADPLCAIAESPPPLPSALSVRLDRRIKLPASEWARVTWRPRPKVAPEKPRSFDLVDCLEQTKTAFTSWGSLDLRNLAIPRRLTENEAWFWLLFFEAVTDPTVRSAAELETWLLNADAGELPAPSKLRQRASEIFERSRRIGLDAPQVLIPFFSPLEIAEKVIRSVSAAAGNDRSRWRYAQANLHRAMGFTDLVLPHMDQSQRKHFRDAIEDLYEEETDPTSFRKSLIVSLLARIGGSSRVVSYLKEQPDRAWANRAYFEACMDLLLGLPDEAAFVSETKRLLGHLHTPEDLRRWLIGTEWRHLQFAAESVIGAGSKEDVTTMARILALVEAPEAVLPMLEILLGSKAPQAAEEWFGAHPFHAAVGLVPLAMGSGKLADAAREQLREMHRDRLSAILNASTGHLTPEQGSWLRKEIMGMEEEPAMREIFDLGASQTFEAPEWLPLSNLPLIHAGGNPLCDDELQVLLCKIQDTPLGARSIYIASIRDEADKADLDRFSLKLFEFWLQADLPMRDRWVFHGIGHLGGNDCVQYLVPKINAWLLSNQHHLALAGLECLRAIESDTALIELHSMARRLAFKSLREKANSLIKEIANSRGLTRDQLADRSIPRCGLNPQGTYLFDYGPRSFTFVPGPDLKPMIKDSGGNLLEDLPEPKPEDDAVLAQATRKTWKRFRRTVREALRAQAERMEDAMVSGRRWPRAELAALFVSHPLMINLVRHLIYGVYSRDGKLSRTFRIDQNRRYLNREGKPVTLEPSAQVGIVHPADLDGPENKAWREVVQQFEMHSPFSQLQRPIFRANPMDAHSTEIRQFRGPRISGVVLSGILDRNRWIRATPAEAGNFTRHSKYFPAADLSAVIQYTGMSVGYYEEMQEIEAIYFVRGQTLDVEEYLERVAIKEVSPVVISEALRLANAIVASAES